VEELKAKGRTLIIGGITPSHYAALDKLGVARKMDARNLCPDLEFAVAQAVLLVEEMRAREATTRGAAPVAA